MSKYFALDNGLKHKEVSHLPLRTSSLKASVFQGVQNLLTSLLPERSPQRGCEEKATARSLHSGHCNA